MPLRCPFVLSEGTWSNTAVCLPRWVTSPSAFPVPVPLPWHLNAPRDGSTAAALPARQGALPSLLLGTPRPHPRLPLGQVSLRAHVSPSGATLLPPSLWPAALYGALLGQASRSHGRDERQRFPLRPGEQALEAPSLGQTPGVPAAASDLLRATKSSSPAAERGEPRPSPVSSGWICRRTSLRFPTDGLAASRPAPSLSPAGASSPRFLYWRQGT